MIADMLSNVNLQQIVTDLSIRARKLSISIILMTQSYVFVPKNIRINSTHHFIVKFQTSESFNKSHLTIHWILTLKTS